ncbi:hypothetical protein HII31_07760 [Pseudocercospora fuligena]|uniref:BZIP domain-containing protein n=1 Tax=Pseudocercospora fuligena TaxID=685502 RepID=A0A8H6RGE6_9PEZI|nr:hypothetical protein HII31_07760 [Pseudocercospora fuligena]
MDTQPLEQTTASSFSDQADVFWPTWPPLFEDNIHLESNTLPLSSNMLSPTPIIHSSWSRESSSEESPEASTPDSGTALSSPRLMSTPSMPSESSPRLREVVNITDGRVLKRKAQNRAAQRAHRERQRDRVSGLHAKIQKMEERCRQLQARNRMFELAFQRFFKDGVALLSSRMADETAGFDPFDCALSQDAAALSLHAGGVDTGRELAVTTRVTSMTAPVE